MRSKRFQMAFMALSATGSLILAPTESFGRPSRIKAIGDSPSTYAWSPINKHVSKGGRVVWRNATNVTHQIVAYDPDADGEDYDNWTFFKPIAPGEGTSRRFRRLGTFAYRCKLHSTLKGGNCDGMCGSIDVP